MLFCVLCIYVMSVSSPRLALSRRTLLLHETISSGSDDDTDLPGLDELPSVDFLANHDRCVSVNVLLLLYRLLLWGIVSQETKRLDSTPAFTLPPSARVLGADNQKQAGRKSVHKLYRLQVAL